MCLRITIYALRILFSVHLVFSCHSENVMDAIYSDSIPFSTRAHWMRAANRVLLDIDSPCPFRAFGTVIVNHTTGGLGELVCAGINQITKTGNPTEHGEIVAIGNCTSIFTAVFGYTPDEISKAFSQLSLYTNGEACPMCASAISWAGFKEYIFGTSLDTLINNGWTRIRIHSKRIFLASFDLPSKTKYIPGILSNETDPYFMWQYNLDYPCPTGCQRTASGSSCEEILQ